MIDEVLSGARAGIERYSPVDAFEADAVIVDLRCSDIRARTGIIPGSVHVPRSVLEWRCDPSSGYSNEAVVGRRLILVCDQGYSSSLAAAGLRRLGVEAGDLEGGFEAWLAARMPVAAAPEEPRGLPGMGGSQ